MPNIKYKNIFIFLVIIFLVIQAVICIVLVSKYDLASKKREVIELTVTLNNMKIQGQKYKDSLQSQERKYNNSISNLESRKQTLIKVVMDMQKDIGEKNKKIVSTLPKGAIILVPTDNGYQVINPN
jgi:preprotein translocase subunit SecF